MVLGLYCREARVEVGRDPGGMMSKSRAGWSTGKQQDHGQALSTLPRDFNFYINQVECGRQGKHRSQG